MRACGLCVCAGVVVGGGQGSGLLEGNLEAVFEGLEGLLEVGQDGGAEVATLALLGLPHHLDHAPHRRVGAVIQVVVLPHRPVPTALPPLCRQYLLTRAKAGSDLPRYFCVHLRSSARIVAIQVVVQPQCPCTVHCHHNTSNPSPNLDSGLQLFAMGSRLLHLHTGMDGSPLPNTHCTATTALPPQVYAKNFSPGIRVKGRERELVQQRAWSPS